VSQFGDVAEFVTQLSFAGIPTRGQVFSGWNEKGLYPDQWYPDEVLP
jgi:hypothetical protein